MAGTLKEELAVASPDTILCLKVDRQATMVESSNAVLSLLHEADDTVHVLLQRLSNQRIVTDYRLRPGETICYALRERDKPVTGDVEWHSVIAPTPVLPVVVPPAKIVRVLQQAASFSFRTALVWNLLAILPLLYLFFLPKGCLVDEDDTFAHRILPISACILFIGIPYYAIMIFVRRARRQRYIHEVFALLFCLTPLFLSLFLMHQANVARDLTSPYEAEDGSADKWTNRGY